MAGVLNGIKDGVTGAVGKVGEGANAVGGGLKSGLDASVEGSKAAASKVGEGGKAAMEATLKALSGAAQFQAVFSSNIDKSDAGLKKAFEGVDADSSGQISAKEMSAYIASVYGGPLDESITKEMFKAADTDGDGEISLTEFVAIMRAGPDAKPSEGGLMGGIKGGIGGATNLVGGAVGGATDLAKKGGGAALDGAKGAATKVGDVSKGALEATLKTLGGAAAFQSVFSANVDKSDAGLEKAFKGVDADSSGKISAKEMNAHITKVYGAEMDESIVKEMFKVADTDGDGEVDLNEFKVIMRAGPDSKNGNATADAAKADKPFYKKCLP
jgi:Ca2+-binding EF-hand superfamily protein